MFDLWYLKTKKKKTNNKYIQHRYEYKRSTGQYKSIPGYEIMSIRMTFHGSRIVLDVFCVIYQLLLLLLSMRIKASSAYKSIILLDIIAFSIESVWKAIKRINILFD